jgi:beta-lactamase regulating signal transducer with metallopeptidase domain
MNFSTEFLPEALTHALGWALLHSLWQGALTGLIVALLLILLNRHSARLRYMISMTGLAVMLVMFGVTFAHYYASEETTGIAAGTVILHSTQPETALTPAATSPWEQLLSTGKQYYAAHLPLLVSLWLLGLLVMTLRFLGGLAYTQRLRHYRTSPLGLHWQETLEQVKQSMGVHRGVRLVESALVQVPVAIGYFKPVILFPIGAVTGLSQRQVEAVLAHELAHVLRHDYLFNMLQQVVETLFFYHPAVWWLSSVARAEREHCCDDLAVKACGDKATYARALAQLEALRLPAGPAYALALTGSKGSLLSRVKRLVSNGDLRPSFSEGFMAALVVVAGFMLLSFGAWAGMKEQEQPEEALSYTLPAVEVPAPVAAAALPAPEPEELQASSLTLQDSTGKTSDLIIIKNKKGEIAELYVNGKRIPKKDIPQFEQLIEQRLQAAQQAPRMKKSDRAAALKATEEALREVERNGNTWTYNFNYTGPDSMNFHFEIPPIPPMPGFPPAPGIAPMPPMPPMPPMAPFLFGEEDTKKNKEAQERYKQELKKYEQEMEKYGKQMEKYGAEMEAKADRQARTREPDMRRHEESMRRHEQNLRRHEENMKNHAKRMEEHAEHVELMKKVEQEMIKDGLLKKGEQITDFKINKEGFYVNGKKQSQALYDKYRDLMKTKDGKSFDMTYKRDGKNVQMESTK